MSRCCCNACRGAHVYTHVYAHVYTHVYVNGEGQNAVHACVHVMLRACKRADKCAMRRDAARHVSTCRHVHAHEGVCVPQGLSGLRCVCVAGAHGRGL